MFFQCSKMWIIAVRYIWHLYWNYFMSNSWNMLCQNVHFLPFYILIFKLSFYIEFMKCIELIGNIPTAILLFNCEIYVNLVHKIFELIHSTWNIVRKWIKCFILQCLFCNKFILKILLDYFGFNIFFLTAIIEKLLF